MPLDILCPSCRSSFPVTNAGPAFHVECPSCDAGIGVSVEHPDAHKIGTVPRAAARLAAAPAVKIPAAARADEADDADAGGAGRGGNRSIGWVVFAGSAVGLLVVLAGVGATGYFLFTNLDTSDTPPPRAKAAAPAPVVTTPPGIGPRPAPFTPPGFGTPNPVTKTPFNPPTFPTPKGIAPPKTGAGGPIVWKDSAVTKIDIPEMPAGGPETTTVNLPGRVDQVRPGGGGRYLVMTFQQPRKMVVFDLSTGKQVAERPLDGGPVSFSVGMNKLVTMGLGPRTMKVFTFPELQPDGEVEVPLRLPATGLAMGTGTNGPVFVVATNEIVLVDLEARAVVAGSQKNTTGGFVPGGAKVRASHDGKLFTATFGATTTVFRVENGKWVENNLTTPFPTLPGATADVLYGAGQFLNPDGRGNGPPANSLNNFAFLVPATHGPDFLRCAVNLTGGPPKLSVSVHTGRELNTPTATLGELPELSGPGATGASGPGGGPDEHLFFAPAAKVLAFIPVSKDKIVLRRLKLN